MINPEVSTVDLGIVDALKEPVHSSKPAGKRMIMALTAQSSFIEWLEDRGQLFKEEPVVWCQSVVFKAFATF